MDIKKLIEQVKLNCNISDAGFWGYYSICGMLMRLRELYRNEHSLMPWEPVLNEDISEWISARECMWGELEDEDLHPLEFEGEIYDPFEVEGLNAGLGRHGLVYGAGYGRFNKPTFFLSRLESIREVSNCRVYYTGRELCRDLSTSVAMLQGRSVFIRLEPLRSLLWDKFRELQGRRFGGALKEAFSLYGIEAKEEPSEEFHEKIETLSSGISEMLLLHELGEAFESERPDEWLGILSHNSDRWTEFYLRGIKDLLADTSEKGPIKFMVERRERSLLGFYIVLLDGIRKELFPEIMNAFQHFVESNDWSVIEEARKTGYKRADKLMKDLLRVWRERGEIGDVKVFMKDHFGTSDK